MIRINERLLFETAFANCLQPYCLFLFEQAAFPIDAFVRREFYDELILFAFFR